MQPDPQYLLDLAHFKMPFGKYAGRYLDEIPEAYYVWFKQKGWPEGQLGQHLQSMFEIKVNGLEKIIREVRSRVR